MKFVLLLSVMYASLISGIVETEKGTFIKLYAKKTSSSDVVATVATHKGKLTKKYCSKTSENVVWCKVEYSTAHEDIHGFIDKNSLITVLSTPKQRRTYETSFGGSSDDVGKSIIPLEDGALIVGYTGSFNAEEMMLM